MARDHGSRTGRRHLNISSLLAALLLAACGGGGGGGSISSTGTTAPPTASPATAPMPTPTPTPTCSADTAEYKASAAVGLSSPLRRERATAIVDAPVSFDLITGVLTMALSAVNLTPHARELDLEFGWTRPLSPTSSLRLGIARAFAAGHVAEATDTAGYLTLVIR